MLEILCPKHRAYNLVWSPATGPVAMAIRAEAITFTACSSPALLCPHTTLFRGPGTRRYVLAEPDGRRQSAAAWGPVRDAGRLPVNHPKAAGPDGWAGPADGGDSLLGQHQHLLGGAGRQHRAVRLVQVRRKRTESATWKLLQQWKERTSGSCFFPFLLNLAASRLWPHTLSKRFKPPPRWDRLGRGLSVGDVCELKYETWANPEKENRCERRNGGAEPRFSPKKLDGVVSNASWLLENVIRKTIHVKVSCKTSYKSVHGASGKVQFET